MAFKQLIVCAVLACVLAGCATTRSTPMNRTTDDKLTKDMHPSPRGIPITIKVPSHVDVYIYEKYFYQALPEDQPTTLRQVTMSRPTLWVDVQPIETEKVVTVDWKRPLSGTLAYGTTLGSDQYFDSINSKITDTTIKDVTAAIKAIAATPTAAGKVQGVTNLYEDDRVVAFKRFDLNECDVESHILEFVHHHLNGCNNCLGFVQGPQ